MKAATFCCHVLEASLLATLLWGCGKHVDERYAGLNELSPSDRSFTIRYLSPPWRFGEQLGPNIRIEIPRAGESVAGPDAEIDPFPKYRLTTQIQVGSPGELSDTITPPADALDVVPRQAFETYEQVDGVERGWRDPTTDVNHRIVLLPHIEGTLRIDVVGFPQLFVPEMTDMLRSVSVATEIEP